MSLTLDSSESGGRTYQLSTTSVGRCATGDHKKRNTALIMAAPVWSAIVGAIAGGGKELPLGQRPARRQALPERPQPKEERRISSRNTAPV
jgi:hypothetical protein